TGLGWVLQDQADLQKDNALFQESIDTLQKSVRIKDDQSNAHSALGWSYYGLKQYDRAEQSFQRAVDLKSDYADAFYGLGRALEGPGKRDQAKQADQTAADHGSTSAKDALERLK